MMLFAFLRRMLRRPAVLLVCMGVLFCWGCSPRETVEEAAQPIVVKAEDAVPVPQPEPRAEEEPVSDIDLSAYAELVISKVYGSGGSSSGACSCGFIELTNAGAEPVDLGALALYYRGGTSPAYTSFRLPEGTLDAGGSFLIRCGSASKRASGGGSAGTVFRIEDWDAEWAVTLDNREFTLVLAPAGLTPDTTVPPEELPGGISRFAASEGYHFDTAYVSGMSKNTMAVRTAMKQDSGYYLQDLTKATTDRLEQIAPVTMEGKRAVIAGSGLEEVRFSHPAGFYTQKFDLSLTAPAGFDTIYYTTDGSDPTASPTRKRYTSPIPLSDTTQKKFGDTYKTGV